MLRRAFTLIELLMVMSIIAILSGLLITGISLAMGKSKEADSKARQQEIERGIGIWITQNTGTEPPVGFDEDGNSVLQSSELMTATDYDSNNDRLLRSLQTLGDDAFGNSTDLVENSRLVDAYGSIFHYRPARTYNSDPDEPNGSMAGYQLWSIGEDLTNQDGGGDDLGNFKR